MVLVEGLPGVQLGFASVAVRGALAGELAGATFAVAELDDAELFVAVSTLADSAIAGVIPTSMLTTSNRSNSSEAHD